MFSLRIIQKNITSGFLPKYVRTIQSQRVQLKEHSEDCLNVEVKGEKLKFPYVWLRDNCQCESCFHYSAKSRTIDWSQFNVNVKPKDVERNEDSVRVTWEDGHQSQFGVNWLKLRSFTPEHQRNYQENIYRPRKIMWKREEFNEIFSKHDYNDILNSDQALYNWLNKLSIYGVAIIENAPNSETAADKIVEKIGFTKQTHYGPKFIVQNVANTSNVAYLSTNLQMHIDLPYYEYVPGANLLHCLVQTESKGGENLLSDCHYVAQYIRDHHPEQYKLLTDVEVEWSDVGVENGNEFFKLYRSPVICLDRSGEIIKIRFSIPQRGSHFPGPVELVKPWYEAHGLFLELNYKFAAKFKVKPGDILSFDNTRLVHGRNGYEDSSNNVRKLIGAHLDWDEIYSRWRCLKIKLETPEGIS